MKAVFKKTETGILTFCNDSLALFDKVPDDSMVMVEYKKKRNYENHKRFFAFLDIAFDLQEFYEEKEHLRIALQMIAGHYEALIIIGKDGEPSTHYTPKSIDFSAMDEIEFRDMFGRCITGFINRYGNGITEEELLRVIDFD